MVYTNHDEGKFHIILIIIFSGWSTSQIHLLSIAYCIIIGSNDN